MTRIGFGTLTRTTVAVLGMSLVLLGRMPECGAGMLEIISQRFVGGTGDESGTGVAVVPIAGGQAVYVSGTSNVSGQEGRVIRYDLPDNASGPSQAWSTPWSASFRAVAATADAAYAAGPSFSRTSDIVGSKEAKGLTVSFGAVGGAVAWERQTPAAPGAYTYGGIESLTSVAVATQAGQTTIFAAGGGQSGFSNGSRLFLSKVDSGGNVAWTRTDNNGGGTPASLATGVATDGLNAYISGYTQDPGVNTTLLRKYDTSGNLVWARTSTAGLFNGLTVDGGGGHLFVVGQTTGANRDFLIEEWDLDGNRLWSRTYDRGGAEDILQGVALVDGRLYAAGLTRGETAGGSDGILFQVNPDNGDLLDTLLWGGAGDDSFAAIAASGNFIHLVGSTRSFGAGGSDQAYVLVRGVPEPGTISLVSIGCLGFVLRALRRRGRA